MKARPVASNGWGDWKFTTAYSRVHGPSDEIQAKKQAYDRHKWAEQMAQAQTRPQQ